jgi:hypothetical protein
VKQRLLFIRRHPLWVAMMLVILFVVEPAADHFLEPHRSAADILIPGMLIFCFTGITAFVVWRYYRTRLPGYCRICGQKLLGGNVQFCPECGWSDFRCKCGNVLQDASAPKCPECGEQV